MFPSRIRRGRTAHPRLGATVVSSAVALLVLPSAQGIAAPAAPPRTTAEPVVSGRAEQGRTLSASRGSWTGTGPISYATSGCAAAQDGGRPDGGDCAIVSGATRSSYQLAGADVGFRMRVRVTATNAEGSQTVASNPTAVVVGPPVNTSLPLVAGTPLVGLGRDRGAGKLERATADLVLVPWLRCNSAGGECVAIGGASGRSYRLTASDVEPQAPLQRHGAELGRLDDRHLGRVGARHRAAADRGDPAAERRDLDPGDERAVRPAADRVAGRRSRRTRSRSRRGQITVRVRVEGHARVRRPRRARVRPLDAARDDGGDRQRRRRRTAG